MILGPVFRQSRRSMKRRLFGYMLILAALLMFALIAAFILFGRFHSEEQNTFEELDIQMEFLERNVFNHFDELAGAGVELSREMSALLAEELDSLQLSFAQLSDHGEAIAALQEAMIEPLRLNLLQENCSGAFVMLNATVNRSLPDADYSRTGLYLQQSGYNNTDESVLLYRGIAETGKRHDIMPHRKWRLEFRSDMIPGCELLEAHAPETAYRFTEAFTLPGTSDKVMLLMAPLLGPDGSLWGVCGYEVSQSYFMSHHAQPTKLPHLSCLLAPGTGELLDAESGLSCGGSNGYYRAPAGTLELQELGSGLSALTGSDFSYVSVVRALSLSPNNPDFSLAVMIPREDYDRALLESNLQSIIIWLLLLFFAVVCCLYFSKRFLSPILRALDRIKAGGQGGERSDVQEIDDLFAFLAEKDTRHRRIVHSLESEKQAAHREQERLRSEYESAQKQIENAQVEISRLAYSRSQEVDPDEYRHFLDGIERLTPTERRIFDFYLDGKTVKEIMVLANIMESTLRYHNKNIYSKLGVNSLKQLLRFAALMRREDAGDAVP